MVNRSTLNCSHWWEFVYRMSSRCCVNGPSCCDFSRRCISEIKSQKEISVVLTISDRLTSGTCGPTTCLIGWPNPGHPAMTTKVTVMSSINAERSVLFYFSCC